MSGSSRNIRLADWMYEYLQEKGEATVQEIKYYINTERKQSRSSRRTPFHTFSSNVISQVLRTSPLFDKSGYTFNTYDGARGKVMVWRARTTEEIIEKVGVRKHPIRKTQPKAVKNALETIGVKV